MGPAGLFALDTSDYAARLDRLLSDCALYELLAGKARVHAERYYALDSCVRLFGGALERAAGHRDVTVAEPQLPYGQSDLGFLVAGAVDDPASVAHHIVAGGIPQAPAAELVPYLVQEGSSYHEAGSANTILALVAASRATASHLHVPPGAEAAAVEATIWLNNWEQRLFVTVASTAADVDVAALRGADVVAINSPDWTAELVSRMRLDASADRPTLLLQVTDRAATTSSLEALGYDCRALGDQWYVCLHPAHHARLREGLAVWARQRRRARRHAKLAAPRGATLRIRARLGARADRLRFSLHARRR
jgi:hypothetical protein